VCGGTKFSFTVRAFTQRSRFIFEPALSLVPEPRAAAERLLPHHAPGGLVVDSRSCRPAFRRALAACG
jgi:hypothetical protein